MKKRFLVFGLLILFSVAAAQAARETWPKIAEALSAWQGAKQVTLRTDATDPFASRTVQELLEMLLAQGYEVRTAPVTAEPEKGLVLDHRSGGKAPVVVLSAAQDGSILSMERMSSPAGERSSGVEKSMTPPQMEDVPTHPRGTLAGEGGDASSAAAMTSAPFELVGRPRSLAQIGRDAEGRALIGVLYDDRIETVRLGTQGPVGVGSCSSPLDGSRALHLDAGDLDGDGEPEVAAVWAVDRRDIDRGTESEIHAWILDPVNREGICSGNGDLAGYLRIVGKKAYWQGKGANQPFAGPVRLLLRGEEGYRHGDAEAWGKRDLFEATPISAERAVAWSDSGKLQLLERGTGRPMAGGTLLADLGGFEGPEVASRLKTPEFRSGFARQDRVMETYHALGRKISVAAEERSVYTVSSNRSRGLPLLGDPSGNDALVRIVEENNTLRLENPYSPVPAFILDFALLPSGEGTPGAVLLLNEKEDGSGKAFLQLQEGA